MSSDDSFFVTQEVFSSRNRGRRMETLKIAQTLLENRALCDYCLGRQFALLAHGLTNKERGGASKLLLIAEGHRLVLHGDESGKILLQTVAVNGFSDVGFQTLNALGLKIEEKNFAFFCVDFIFFINSCSAE